MKYINSLLILLFIISGIQEINTHSQKDIVKAEKVSTIKSTSLIISKVLTDNISTDVLPIKQKQILSFAYSIAKQDGINHPEFLQGILMKESGICNAKHFRVAGPSNKPSSRYFGCGQIKLAAAKSVMNRFPNLWKYLETKTDEELQARLILDDRFNVRITSKYIIMMGINDNPDRAITAYNVGLGAVDKIDINNFEYTNSVKSYSEKLNYRNHQLKNIQS